MGNVPSQKMLHPLRDAWSIHSLAVKHLKHQCTPPPPILVQVALCGVFEPKELLGSFRSFPTRYQIHDTPRRNLQNLATLGHEIEQPSSNSG